MLGSALSLTDTAIRSRGRPVWVPSGASAFWDFVNNRYWRAPYSFARASTKYAENLAGAYSSFAANALARTDKGALIEPARTNLVHTSHPGGYTSNQATKTLDASPSPLGGSGMVRVTRTTTGVYNEGSINPGAPLIQVDPGVKYALSAVVRDYGYGAGIQFTAGLSAYVTESGSVQGIAYGAFSGAADLAVGKIELSPGVYILWASATTTGTAVGDIWLWGGREGGSVDNVPVGYFADYDGVQFEAAAAATSRIVTAGAAATRAADSLTLSLASGEHSLTFTFDDGSTQVISGASGSYSVPTNLNRSWIKNVKAVRQ